MAVPVRPVVKRTARAILLEDDPGDPHAPATMLLIRRVRPGAVHPYWITPGGGVEPGDRTVVDALHREVDEELGAKVQDVVPAFVDTVAHSHHDDGTRPLGHLAEAVHSPLEADRPPLLAAPDGVVVSHPPRASRRTAGR